MTDNNWQSYQLLVLSRLDNLEADLKGHKGEFRIQIAELVEQIHSLRNDVQDSLHKVSVSMRMDQIEKLTNDLQKSEDAKKIIAQEALTDGTYRANHDILFKIVWIVLGGLILWCAQGVFSMVAG